MSKTQPQKRVMRSTHADLSLGARVRRRDCVYGVTRDSEDGVVVVRVRSATRDMSSIVRTSVLRTLASKRQRCIPRCMHHQQWLRLRHWRNTTTTVHVCTNRLLLRRAAARLFLPRWQHALLPIRFVGRHVVTALLSAVQCSQRRSRVRSCRQAR